MTDRDSHKSQYDLAMELAEAGRHDEALRCIQDHLLSHPADGQALNDAGALLYALGRFDEAAEHLKMALGHLDAAPAQTLWNLAEVYLADGHPGEAMALFGDLAEAEVLTADLANRTATAFLERDDRAGALEALIRSRQIAPDQAVLEPIVQRLRQMRAKVGLFCRPGDTKLLGDLRDFIEPRFESQIFRGHGKDDLVAFLHWCDIAWFEHCSPEAILVSRLPKACRTVVHVHPHEAYRPWIEQVVWPRTDVLVTTANRHVREFIGRRLPDAAAGLRIEHLPLGVEASKLPFHQHSPGKNIACVGNLSLRKNPMLLIQCFRRLHAIDEQFRLFFAGYFQDDMLEPYLRGLLEKLGLGGSVFFDGWQEDLPAWLADKDYIASASLVEGHGTGVLEAMAMGLKPLVHAFPGAEEIYRAEDLYRTPEEFCWRILEGPGDPQACRRFVEQHFPPAAMQQKVNDILVELESMPLPKPARSLEPAEATDASPGGEPQAANRTG